MPHSPLFRVSPFFWLWLGAARPIELVIDAGCQHVQIGTYGHRRNRREIIIFAAEIVEVILDLAGDIFYQAKLDANPDCKASPIITDDLRGEGSSGWNLLRGGDLCGEKIFSVLDVHPGTASLSVKEPVVRGVADPTSQGGKPQRMRGEALLSDGAGHCRCPSGRRRISNGKRASRARNQSVSLDPGCVPGTLDADDPGCEFVISTNLAAANHASGSEIS